MSRAIAAAAINPIAPATNIFLITFHLSSIAKASRKVKSLLKFSMYRTLRMIHSRTSKSKGARSCVLDGILEIWVIIGIESEKSLLTFAAEYCAGVKGMKTIANRKLALQAIVIAVVVASVFGAAFAVAANPRIQTTESKMMAVAQEDNFNQPWPAFRRLGPPGNVTISSAQAKAIVEASIPSFKIGTVTSLGTCWLVPIEDSKGVVTSIQVSRVSASTAEQAKSVVQGSLGTGWKAGEPRLIRTIYEVPLIDSKDATIAHVSVDGNRGEIIRKPSTILTVTSQQAKTTVSNAIKEFTVGEARDAGSTWMVNIKYKDKVVMTVVLGKLNTPTSENAVKAVQDSLKQGWSPGEPRQLQSIYNVPIIDINNNTIGNVRVDGRTGDIAAGLRPGP